MSKHLSKSMYVSYCQYPKAMWLTVHHPELEVIDAQAEERFLAGNEVGYVTNLFPDDSTFDYHILSWSIQNGGEVMTTFPKIKDMIPADQEKARNALLEY